MIAELTPNHFRARLEVDKGAQVALSVFKCPFCFCSRFRVEHETGEDEHEQFALRCNACFRRLLDLPDFPLEGWLSLGRVELADRQYVETLARRGFFPAAYLVDAGVHPSILQAVRFGRNRWCSIRQWLRDERG